MATYPKPLTLKALRAHPQTSKLFALPEAEKKGTLKIGAGRGATFQLAYRIHGHGPVKLLWLPGHGMFMRAWKAQMDFFGNSNADKFTSLFLDFRGVGESEGTWSWCPPKTLAEDTVEVLDKLGWTEDKQVNLIGFSMGGYVTQEIALLIPRRIKSLCFLASTSNFGEGRGVGAWINTVAPFLTAFTEDARANVALSKNISNGWRYAPDPTGEYPTNGDRFAAFLMCNPEGGNIRGVLLSMPGAATFRIPEMSLKKIGDDIGRDKIMVMQGTADSVLDFEASKVLARGLRAEHVKNYEGLGHCFMMEARQQVYADIEKFLEQVYGDEKSD